MCNNASRMTSDCSSRAAHIYVECSFMQSLDPKDKRMLYNDYARGISDACFVMVLPESFKATSTPLPPKRSLIMRQAGSLETNRNIPDHKCCPNAV